MSDGHNIQVFVRSRPLNNGERKSSVEFSPDLREVGIPTHSRNFHFDQVFSAATPQETVYNSVVRPLVPQVLNGYNCAVLAYGQTGTGKTYTMEGQRFTDRISWDGTGIIPRAVAQIFDTLRQRGLDFTVGVSFLELYNEDAYDLLSSLDDINKLRIFDDKQKKGSVIIDGLKEIKIESEEDIFEILSRGSTKRSTAATLLNACSSRSHSIFTITVNIMADQELIKIGKLNLVDLAGSENIARSGAQNKHAREAGNINQSLLTLTRVITALVEKRPHVPYRESKLTRILQDSLGGSTKTSMIATISPAEDDLGNTIGTLDYASRARCIINRPESNRLTANKTSDLELAEAYKIKLRSEVEIEIRNEVAVEYRRETDKIREHFNKVLSEKDELILELRDKIQDLTRDLEGKSTDQSQTIAELKEQVAELTSQITSLSRSTKLIQRVADDRSELIEQLRLDFKNKSSEYEEEIIRLNEQNNLLKEENNKVRSPHDRIRSNSGDNRENHENLLENIETLVETQEQTETKKAARVRKRPPIQEELNDYANMTFDGDDEIVQCSSKKTRKKITAGGKKRDLYQTLTLSGRKKKLRSVEDAVELSPISPPVRVTRSRATRRRLDY